MEERKRRLLSRTEWLLIAMALFAIVMVISRWEFIAPEVKLAVMSYFE